MKILIVDDDNVSSTLLARILQKNGYKTLVTTRAERAIKHLETGEPIILILLDMVMPDMDGKQFMEQINSKPGMKGIPVIICSGDKLQGSVLQAVKMGAKDYIIKPIDAGVLIDKVGSVLRGLTSTLLKKEQVISKLKIGEDAYKEMLDVLIARGKAAVQEMNGFIKSGDYEKLLCVVVGLKGGAMSLGAERLSSVLKCMEDVVRGQKGDEIQDMAIAVQREVNIINSLLQ